MKSAIFRVALVLLMLHSSGYVSAQMDSLIHNSLTRTYLVHLPSGYSGTTPFPLIIAMHGGFGSAANLQDQSQLSVKADAENFIVVYPEGVKGPLNIRTWNAGWCCGYASANNIDDVGFINTLLDTLISQLAVDTTRIYATGMSNGGFMSYRLACELSHRIAAIAPVAASMSVPVCNPSRAMPIIQFHSYLDTSVPYLGGIGAGTSGHYNAPHDSVLNAWAMKNNCIVVNDTVVNNSQYTFVKWEQCDCGTDINYYITQDGGHSWPGGNQTPVGDPASVFISANDLMWDFFGLHTLGCDSLTAVNQLNFADEDLSIFPNPSTGFVYVNASSLNQVQVLDAAGKIVEVPFIKNDKQPVLDFSMLPAGVYLLRTTHTDGSIANQKIIII